MQTMKPRRAKLFYILILCTLFFSFMTEQTAEASRRGRGRGGRGSFFGRRGNPSRAKGRKCQSGCRQRQEVARSGNRQVGNRSQINGLNNLDREALGRQAVDPFSSLSLDPTGELSRLAGATDRNGLQRINGTNIAVNDQGEFFEQQNNRALNNDRPLVFNDGKILGGAIIPLSDDTLEQVRQGNESGAFRRLGLRRR